MSTPIFLQFLWRKLPLAPHQKARLRQFLLRTGSKLKPEASTALEAIPSTKHDPVAPSKQEPLGQMCLQPTRFTPAGCRDWIFFGIIGWNFRIQRPQHLAKELARAGDTVFYIEPIFVDSDRPGCQIRQIDPDLPLYAVQLHLKHTPQIYFNTATAAEDEQLRLSMAHLWAQWGIHASTAIVQHPYWTRLAWAMPNSLQIYDCMDHHEGFGGMPPTLVAQEHEYMDRADIVTVTSQWLHDWAGTQGRQDAVIIRNGCDYDHFATLSGLAYTSNAQRKVIGYFGAIAQWFDVELVQKIATRFSDCDIVLVGDDTIEAGKSLKHLSNVHLLGEKPYAELPHYLHGFDVCLLPFQRIPLTLATNPVKVYEYLCTGTEVVCTDLPEISQFGDLVHKADNHESFMKAIEQALHHPANANERMRRQAFAQSQTWANRAQHLKQQVQALNLPSISVVVLTYNNWSYTKDCLHSLFTRSEYPGRLEVIVSDNASSDETVARLKEWAARESRLKLVLNAKNLGFSAGNNAGLAAATGDYLVMLNNDTVVTRGWLLTLVRHFQANSDLGLLGPATNHIGNESKVPVEYASLTQMPLASRVWTLAHMGQKYPMRTLAFFCVIIPRAVFESTGPMDENFGRGFFEDDDYCRRIEKQGLSLACADDVLVHHRLSASFEKIDNSERQALFERNRKYYESKWGPWVTHKYRDC